MKTATKTILRAIKGGNQQVPIETIDEQQRLSLAECKAIMSKGDIVYSDAELLELRDYLYQLAAIATEQLEIGKEETKVIALHTYKKNKNEESNYLRTG